MTLEKDLENFYGTEHYYRVLPMCPIVVTDGVKHFMDAGNAYWAVTEILLHTMKMKNQPFLAIKVVSKDSGDVIIYWEDGNYNGLRTQTYNNTDLEVGTYRFYIIHNVMMVTSEY